MLFGEIDLPDTLLIAQSEGKLVIFAGAGVSQGAPSNLPDFRGLAAAIAQRALTETESSDLDRFLGKLEDQKVDVHLRACAALRISGSRSTHLHDVLLKLFARPEHVRVVTTNFDPHFRTLVQANDSAVPVFTAPALPRGNNFHGLVQLHGTDEGPPRDMVLTDRDFGRAYLTEGWARIFVERLFAEYTVLFVGYSLRDPPMHYLARGLSSNDRTRRFALTDEQDDSRWERLGVTPVRFPLAVGSDPFVHLTQGVTRWMEVTRGSGFILEQQIIQILKQPDPSALSPNDAALVEWSLGQEHSIAFFTTNADGLHWVEWLVRRRRLEPYFDPHKRLMYHRERQLAGWLADQLIKHPVPRALAIVHAHGGRFCPDLYRSLTHRMHSKDTSVEWVALLAQQLDQTNRDAQSFFGEKLRELSFANSPAYLTLFQVLTTPRLGSESHELGGDPTTAQFTFDITGAADELWSAWTEGISHRIPDHARLLLDLLISQLQRAAQLAASVGNVEGFYRRITNWRPRIATRDRTQHHGHYADVIVDMLVELVTHLARTPSGLSESDFSRWLDSDNRVLRRLGVHALDMSTELTTEAKLAALNIRLEIWPERSAERREGEWLRGNLATPVPAKLQGAPTVNELPPAEVPLRPLDELLTLTSPDLHEHLVHVRLTPTEGLALLVDLAARALRTPALWEHPIWSHILDRTPWKTVDATGRDQLLAILQPPFPLKAHADAIIRSLFEQDPLGSETAVKPTPAQVSCLFDLSCRVWPYVADRDDKQRPVLKESDWASLALNHVTFRLVLFWLHYASLQTHNTEAPCLPIDLATIFTEACTLRSDTARRVRATLAKEIAFLMARDPDWVARQLLPQFDFASLGDEAWVTWQPFLAYGNLSRPVALAMLPKYQQAQAILLAGREEVMEGYLEDVAALAVHLINPLEAGWLKNLLTSLSELNRARWARLVDNELDRLSDEQQNDLWNRWLRQYWSERNTGMLGDIPLLFTGREIAIMTRWTLALPAVFAEALALLTTGPAPDFSDEFFAWREVAQSTALAERHPQLFVDFIQFLLNHIGTRVYYESIVEATTALPRLTGLRAPLLQIAERMLRDGWRGSRNFKDWVECEFPS